MVWPLCMCGCGEAVGLAPKTNRRKGLVKGRPTRFVTGHYADRAARHRKPPPSEAELERRRQRKAQTVREWRVRRAEHCRRVNAERFARTRDAVIRQRRESGAAVRHSAERRARLAGATVERVDPLIVWERDHGVCGICGGRADPTDWHLDHVIALAAGGAHSYANTQVAHPGCNLAKGKG